MEEFTAFMNAINPYGALNWFSAAYCGYVYSRIGNGLILVFTLLNIGFGILGLLGI